MKNLAIVVISFLANWITVFLLGIGVGLLVYLIFNRFSTLDDGETIDIIAIIVNIIVGAAIVIIVQKKLSDDRGVKDYFIQEVGEIKKEYSVFINQLLRNKLSAQYSIEWFKVMSVRISHLEKFLKETLKVSDTNLVTLNRYVHRKVTDREEFNNSFTIDKYTPSVGAKNQVLEIVSELKYSLINTIVKINKA